MDDEVLLDGFEQILMAPGATPFFVQAERYVRTDTARAEAIVVDRILTDAAQPNWSVLRLLGICEHPCDMHPGELRRLILRQVRGRRIELYERLPAARTRGARALQEDVPSAPTRRSAQPRHYLALEAFDEEGQPLTNLLLALHFADGDARTRSTGARGGLRVNGIAAGACKVQLIAG